MASMSRARPTVVGRDRERAALADFLARRDGPAAFVLEGEAGVGKTTLGEAGLGGGRDRQSRRGGGRPPPPPLPPPPPPCAPVRPPPSPSWRGRAWRTSWPA